MASSQSEHEHGIELDVNGNCALCHQPIKVKEEARPARKRASRVCVAEPLGEEGTLDELALILSERWEGVWPTMAVDSPGWKYRVWHAALFHTVDAGVMPKEEGS